MQSPFWTGFTGVMNIAGVVELSNVSDGSSSDADALGKDWRAVGDDLREAAPKSADDDSDAE